jgi:hypothetical protein
MICTDLIRFKTAISNPFGAISKVSALAFNMYDATTLWKAPDINPLNRKARTIPGFNPINLYGRVFFFSWFGFLIAFWSWFGTYRLIDR